jgi:putative oxidoreductase
MPAAIPFRPFWVMTSGIVELTGATLVATGRSPRLGGWLLFVFLVPVTVTVHGTAMLTATDPVMQRIQTSFFLKGVTMPGAALLIAQLGVRTPER